MKDLDMIISYEDLERNRRRVLAQDQKKAKAAKKEKRLTVLVVGLFYVVVIAGVLLLECRMSQIEDQQKTTAVNAVEINERAVQ